MSGIVKAHVVLRDLISATADFAAGVFDFYSRQFWLDKFVRTATTPNMVEADRVMNEIN